MTDKKELSNEELENVNGGGECVDAEYRYYEDNFKCKVNKYEASNYIGEEVYVKKNGTSGEYVTPCYYGGILLDVYNESAGCGDSGIVYKVLVLFVTDDAFESAIGQEITYSADSKALYVRINHA